MALLLALVSVLLGRGPAHAATHHAGLLIEHSSSWPGPQVFVRCVEFVQESISGLALLQLAGVNSGQPPQVYDWGAGALTVCQIDGEPRRIPDRCFGPVSGPNWSDWQATGPGWIPRSSGTSGYVVHDGELEGWTDSLAFGARPPSSSFTQICPPAATSAPVATPAAAPPSRAATTATAGAAPTLASASPPPTPTLEAMAPPSTSPLTAASGATASSRLPPSGGLPAGMLGLGVSVSLLGGLLVWNLRRRGS